jgi:hypothetical protein
VSFISYRGKRFQVPTRLTTVTCQTGEYKVDLTRHPKFPLAFGELASGRFTHLSRLGGVVLTSPSLHTECISEYKLNYPPFQILDSNHIPSCTSAGSVLQLDVSITIPE